MVLFFYDSKDLSSSKILEWLFAFNKKEVIVVKTNENYPDFIALKKYTKKETELIINDKILNSSKITSIFFRRNDVKMRRIDKNNFRLSNNIQNFIYSNLECEKELLTLNFNKYKQFGNAGASRVNKVVVLQEAEKVGLKIPDYLLTSYKSDLMLFFNKHKSIVVKSPDLGFFDYHPKKKSWYVGYTSDLNELALRGIPKTFPLSFFQQKIEKLFEVRVFYFNNMFFSNAIFSQNNLKTQTDYRRYDQSFMNREVPINLPKDLKKKLIILFKKLNLNTGSVDLIYNSSGFVFLEINPVGQFDNVSIQGNWYIEREIAKYLICK